MTQRRVWTIFRRNTPALFGLILFCLFCLMAILAPILSPDRSVNASRQISEAIRVKPGTNAYFLVINKYPESAQNNFKNLFIGEELNQKWFRIKNESSYYFKQDTIEMEMAEGDFRNLLLPVILFHPNENEPFNQVCMKNYSKPYCLIGDHCIWTDKGIAKQVSLTEMKTEFQSNNLISFTWWMGSDAFGRDVYSRMLKGSRVSIGVGMAALFISLLVGIPLGIIAGYFGGITDKLIQGLISVIWSLPSLLLAMVLSFVLGKGFWQVFLAVGLTLWVDVARMVRGSVLGLKESLFIEAAKTLGYSTPRILWVHILPNLAGPVILVSASCFATAILIESGLSFLGIGIQAPMPSWGNLLQEGYTQIVLSGGQWLAIYPSLAIVCLVVSLNLIGYGLRDALDPKEKV